jgi:hypothetical protein
VAAEDYERLSMFVWAIGPSGYPCRWIGKRVKFLHHEALETTRRVDHVNGDPLDNRRTNLRLASARQNAMNRRQRCDNLVGFKGVFRNGNRFGAHIRTAGQLRFLGNFGTPEEAARVHDAATQEHFGEFARPNFPGL